MTASVSATPVSSERYHLGEGVHQDSTGIVRWVDISHGLVLEGEIDEELRETRRLEFDTTVGVALPADDGGLVVATGHGILTVSPDGTRSAPLALLDPARSRFNDGVCDPDGRLIVGSLSLSDAAREEKLFRIEHDGTATVLSTEVTLSNGLGFSPAGDVLYHVDSVPGIVWTRPYDSGSTAVAPAEVAFEIGDGIPDGLRVDVEGCLWIAIWGAGQVRRYTPDGRLLTVVEVDAPEASCPGFLHSRPGAMLITTARESMDAEALAAAPESGRVFLAEVGVDGLPLTAWRGSTTRPPWATAS